mmetsp:Transcript_16915/g.46320  ORF Transcript_16915/g.46320 Transcript_16915/m.46320 type:complete len:525 (+) Transcript_16915:1357-2931(+)
MTRQVSVHFACDIRTKGNKLSARVLALIFAARFCLYGMESTEEEIQAVDLAEKCGMFWDDFKRLNKTNRSLDAFTAISASERHTTNIELEAESSTMRPFVGFSAQAPRLGKRKSAPQCQEEDYATAGISIAELHLDETTVLQPGTRYRCLRKVAEARIHPKFSYSPTALIPCALHCWLRLSEHCLQMMIEDAYSLKLFPKLQAALKNLCHINIELEGATGAASAPKAKLNGPQCSRLWAEDKGEPTIVRVMRAVWSDGHENTPQWSCENRRRYYVQFNKIMKIVRTKNVIEARSYDLHKEVAHLSLLFSACGSKKQLNPFYAHWLLQHVPGIQAALLREQTTMGQFENSGAERQHANGRAAFQQGCRFLTGMRINGRSRYAAAISTFRRLVTSQYMACVLAEMRIRKYVGEIRPAAGISLSSVLVCLATKRLECSDGQESEHSLGPDDVRSINDSFASASAELDDSGSVEQPTEQIEDWDLQHDDEPEDGDGVESDAEDGRGFQGEHEYPQDEIARMGETEEWH